VLQDPATEATVLLTEALQEGLPWPPVPVIIDVDVFRVMRLPAGDASAWEYLNQLRVVKNVAFFRCLTQTGVELYL
jgi:hypothetical protein